MKRIISYLFLACLFIPFTSGAQHNYRNANYDEDMVEWSASRPLTWDDYKGSPDPYSDAAASTTTYLTVSYNISSTHFSYKVSSRFSKSRSWGLHKTAYILSHEQGHFDIAEVFARKLNQRLKDYQFNRRTYEQDLKQIYDEVCAEKKEMQDAYDSETNHSINRVKQAEWLRKIAILLEESEEYADY